jgi:hypothetical protein
MECKQQTLTAVTIVRQTAFAWLLLSIVMIFLLGKCVEIYIHLISLSFEIYKNGKDLEAKYTQLDASLS